MIKLIIGFAFVFLLFASGCATPGPLPPVNLNDPGWELRHGQAVWRTKSDAPEIAGDFLLAMNSNGASYLQFSKTLPIVSARLNPSQWEIEFAPESKRYAGGGKPPKRIIWFQLIRGIEGRELPDDWLFSRKNDGAIISHIETGEHLEIFFQE